MRSLASNTANYTTPRRGFQSGNGVTQGILIVPRHSPVNLSSELDGLPEFTGFRWGIHPPTEPRTPKIKRPCGATAVMSRIPGTYQSDQLHPTRPPVHGARCRGSRRTSCNGFPPIPPNTPPCFNCRAGIEYPHGTGPGSAPLTAFRTRRHRWKPCLPRPHKLTEEHQLSNAIERNC